VLCTPAGLEKTSTTGKTHTGGGPLIRALGFEL
jgi:hypothetical protein